MTPATSQINYLEANAQSLKLLLDSGRCTSVDLVCRYLKRIERDNTNGATIRAIIEVDSHVKLTELAQQLDAEREAGKTRGPLHGIPIVVKVRAGHLSFWPSIRLLISGRTTSLSVGL